MLCFFPVAKLPCFVYYCHLQTDLYLSLTIALRCVVILCWVDQWMQLKYNETAQLWSKNAKRGRNNVVNCYIDETSSWKVKVWVGRKTERTIYCTRLQGLASRTAKTLHTSSFYEESDFMVLSSFQSFRQTNHFVKYREINHNGNHISKRENYSVSLPGAKLHSLTN